MASLLANPNQGRWCICGHIRPHRLYGSLPVATAQALHATRYGTPADSGYQSLDRLLVPRIDQMAHIGALGGVLAGSLVGLPSPEPETCFSHEFVVAAIPWVLMASLLLTPNGSFLRRKPFHRPSVHT